MEKLRPVCFLDPSKPERYRDRVLLRSILHEALPALPPEETKGEDYGAY
jgi:hypothetical protein